MVCISYANFSSIYAVQKGPMSHSTTTRAALFCVQTEGHRTSALV